MAKILVTVKYPAGAVVTMEAVRKVALSPDPLTRPTCTLGIVVRDPRSGANIHTVPASWVTRA